jgi:Ca2+/Na+ antiporter
MNMLVTLIPYFFIQGAAFAYSRDATVEEKSRDEENFALSGLIVCFVFFVGYLVQHLRNASHDKVILDFTDDVRENAVRSGLISLRGAFFQIFKNSDQDFPTSASLRQPLMMSGGDMTEEQTRFRHIVYKFFKKYDLNGNGHIDTTELTFLLKDLKIVHSQKDVEQFLKEMDLDSSGDISFDEFITSLSATLSENGGIPSSRAEAEATQSQSQFEAEAQSSLTMAPSAFSAAATQSRTSYGSLGSKPPTSASEATTQSQTYGTLEAQSAQTYGTLETTQSSNPPNRYGQSATVETSESQVFAEEEEEEESEEVPEDLAHLPPDEQQRRIIRRSLWMMSLGVAIVLIFSDPLIQVFSELGELTGISGFYISFVLAPLASNASEILASYVYAKRKTSKTITIALCTLMGAAILNNTFVLGIFLSLIKFRQLDWEFSAETCAIVMVELVVGLIVLTRRVHTLKWGLIVLAMFPMSLLLVMVLESSYVGWD